MSPEVSSGLKSGIRAILEVDDGSGSLVGFPPRTACPTFEGMWDVVLGGEYSMQEKKIRPFDGVERTYPGVRETGNLTLEAAFMLADHQAIMLSLNGPEDPRGRRAQVQVLVQDSDGNYQQNRAPYPGMVLTVTGPDGDSNDASIAKIAIVISTGEVPRSPGGDLFGEPSSSLPRVVGIKRQPGSR